MTRLMLSLAVVLISGAVSTARAGLIASWSANGNANDSVAGRNGTLQNGAGFDLGISSQAFRLDGVNDFVSVLDDNVWTFGTSPFTVSLWANFDVVKQQTLGQLPNIFIGHDEGGGTKNKWVFFYDDNGQLAFHINGPGTGSAFLTAPSNFFPTVGSWHHFALTRSGNTYTFFADGSSLGTRSDARSIPNANAALTIGQAEGLGYFDGRLDEVQIYNQALSSSQIGQLATIPEPASLIVWSVLGVSALGLAARRRRRRKPQPRP